MVKWESTWTLQHLFFLSSSCCVCKVNSIFIHWARLTPSPLILDSVHHHLSLSTTRVTERRPKLETFPIDICFSLAWPGRALRVDYTLATPPPALKGVEKGENVSFINFSLSSIIVLQNWNLCVNIELIIKSPSLFLFCKHLLIEISSVATPFYHFISLLDCKITLGHREDMDFSCRHVR